MNRRKMYKEFSKFRYESIVEYNSFVEKNIENTVSGIQKKYDNFIEENPDFETLNDDESIEAYSFIDDLAHEKKKFSKDILLKHRQSILFHFYSFLEIELYSISRILGENNVFKISDLKGNSTFEQFKLYIKKIEPSLFEKIHPELLFFDRIRLIRNFITHHNSVIKENSSHFNKIKMFEEERYKIELIGTNTENIDVHKIVLDKNTFMKEIFEVFEIFINKVYE